MPRESDDGVPIRTQSKRVASRKAIIALATTILVGAMLAVAGTVAYYQIRKPNNPEVIFERWQKAGRDGDWSAFYDHMDESSQFSLAMNLETRIQQETQNTPEIRRFKQLKGKQLYLEMMSNDAASTSFKSAIAAYLIAPVVGVQNKGDFADIEVQMPQTVREIKAIKVKMKWQAGAWRVVCPFPF